MAQLCPLLRVRAPAPIAPALSRRAPRPLRVAANQQAVLEEAQIPLTRRDDGALGVQAATLDRPADASVSPILAPIEPQPAELAGQPAASAPADRRALWMAAIKPPMYSVGFIPVLVGAAAVYMVHGVLPLGRTVGLVLAAILVIAWLNLSNDAFDAHTGVDKAKAESVVNLLGGPKRQGAVLLLAKALLAAGAGLLAHLIAAAPGADPRPGALLAFSIACGYVYQGPPFRLSYKGLGEPLCFFAFGPSATVAFFLALQPDGAAAAAAAAAAGAGAGPAAVLAAGVPAAVWACSVLVGLTTTAILFCSHFHQIAGDTAAGKRSPLVRLGTERGRHVLRAAAGVTQGAAVLAAAAGALPWAAAAATVLAAPAAATMVRFADDNHTVPERVAPLKRFAVKWHILYGLCLCLGLAAARALGGGVAPV